jgi:hypothetical protein
VLFALDPLWPDGIHGRNPDRMLRWLPAPKPKYNRTMHLVRWRELWERHTYIGSP